MTEPGRSAPGDGHSLNDAAEQLTRSASVRVFGCLSGAYFFSYGLRAINAAIAPELVHEFALSNAQLGYLSSAYFLAFALMQIPLGVWLDRYGSRRVHSALLLIGAAGCFVFAAATQVHWLWVGRAMIGAGFAGGLMAALRVFRFWYAADRQQQLMSLMLVVGTAGALMATAPSRMLLPVIGWRGLFVLTGIGILVAAIAVLLILPRNEKLQTPTAGAGSGLGGYRIVLADPFFWRFLIPAIVLQGGFVAFQSLWAGPWFTRVLQMSAESAAQVLFLFNLVLLFAYLALSKLVRVFANRGWTLLQVNTVTGITIVFLHWLMSLTGSMVPGIALWLVWAVITTPFTPVQAWVSMTFPGHIAGRALTAYNLVLFSGIFAVQWFFGALVDWCLTWTTSEKEAFVRALQIWTLFEIAALSWMVFFRVSAYNERHPDAGST